METYIIKGGQEGADRLHILANATWPLTYPFLLNAGLKRGMRCLDAGCGNGEMTKRIGSIVGDDGHVTGIDFDASVIEIAKEEKIENIDFRVHDLENENLKETYDFIYCRFILSHLKSPENVLMKLKNALRKNGILAIEDVDFNGHFCFPRSQAFDTYVQWYEKIGRMKGGNPLIGPELLSMIVNLDLQEIKLNVVLPTFHTGAGKRMAFLTLHAIREAVIRGALATPDEFEHVLKELEDFTHDDSTIMSLPRIFQVSAFLPQVV